MTIRWTVFGIRSVDPLILEQEHAPGSGHFREGSQLPQLNRLS